MTCGWGRARQGVLGAGKASFLSGWHTQVCSVCENHSQYHPWLFFYAHRHLKVLQNSSEAWLLLRLQ